MVGFNSKFNINQRVTLRVFVGNFLFFRIYVKIIKLLPQIGSLGAILNLDEPKDNLVWLKTNPFFELLILFWIAEKESYFILYLTF